MLSGTNGPGLNSGQYYTVSLGSGNEFYSGGLAATYRLQIAYQRNNEPSMSCLSKK